MRNSSGLGSWVVFLAYFHLGWAFPKHPPTLAAQVGLQGSSALCSFWEGVTFPPGGDPASYAHIKPSTKSPFQCFPVYYHWPPSLQGLQALPSLVLARAASWGIIHAKIQQRWSPVPAPCFPVPKGTAERPVDLLKARGGLGLAQSDFQVATLQELPSGLQPSLG